MEERARHVQGSSQTKYCAPQKPSFEYDLDQVSFHLVLQCCGCCDTLGLIKAFPELSWDFTSKIKVGLSLTSVGKYCHLAIVWKVTLQDGFSSVTVVHTMAL